VLVVGAIAPLYATLLVAYGFSPKTLDGQYQPVQPVPYSHALHAGKLGLDCRYCHNSVENASHAAVPPTQTCMNCHTQIHKDSPKLEKVRESYATGMPIEWIKVHKLGDYAYFNHAAHVNRGVSCVECHGKVNEMDTVTHTQPLSMAFCLECHRDPASRIRNPGDVFNLNSTRLAEQGEAGAKAADKFKHDWKLMPPQSCSGCHR